MAKIEKAVFDPVDITVLTNQSMPEKWICPHCGCAHETGPYADEILLEHFKYLEHCGNCGYVHAWELILTDDFKKQVVEYLMAGGKGLTP